MDIRERQKITRAALLILAIICILPATMHVVAGNWLGLITTSALAALNLVTRAAVGQNMRLAARNAELEKLVRPDEVRARKLHIAQMERDLGMTSEAP